MVERHHLLLQLVAPPEAKGIKLSKLCCEKSSCLAVYPQATKRETGQKAKAQALRAMLRKGLESLVKATVERGVQVQAGGRLFSSCCQGSSSIIVVIIEKC